MSKTPETKTFTYRAMKAAAYGLFLAGLALSFTHIVGLFAMLGATTLTAYAMPLFIDVPTLMGRIARGDRFAKSTRKIGTKVQLVGGLISLTANVAAGHSVGDKLAGVLIVGGYLFAEWFAGALRPVSDDTAAERKAAAAEARAKGAATRAANKAKADAEKAARAERRAAAAERKRIAEDIAETAAMTAAFAATVAPVSPAVGTLPTTYL